jgi:hypothetical protein
LKSLLFLVLLSVPAAAYTIPSSESGREIRWRYGQKLFMAGNPSGASAIPPDAFRKAAVFGLQQWKWATRGILDFDYWQGEDPAHYPTVLENDGLNAIFFASRSPHLSDPNVIGYTQLLYNSANGDIIEADIILNDRDFEFSSSPTDTTSNGGRRVHLGAVLTHELGHVVGLSHSAEVNASLLHVEFLDQRLLGCDDQLGARQLYSAMLPEEGGLSGQLLTPYGDPLAGARVTVISKSRGVPLATAHTLGDGSFSFQGLEPGTVSVQVAPYSGPFSAIPARNRPGSVKPCGGYFPFPFQFLTGPDGHELIEFAVDPGRNRSIGVHRVSCAGIGNSGTLYQERTAPDLVVDSGPLARTRSYFYNASGPFKVTGLGYLLHSPVSVDLGVYDAQGRPLPVSRESPLYSSESGHRIPDVSVSGTASGRIEVRVTPRSLASAAFPVSIDQSDTPFYYLGFSSTPAASNPRCLPSFSFPSYTSPSGVPPRYASTRSARDGIGFCARAQAESRSAPGARRSTDSSPGDILGWFLPFLLIGAFQLNSVLRRIRLNPRWRIKN